MMVVPRKYEEIDTRERWLSSEYEIMVGVLQRLPRGFHAPRC